MTKEYIEREKAIEWFMAFVHMGESDIPAETVIEDLKYAIPAADVAPVRHGRWVYDYKKRKAICYCCGSGYRVAYNYCPNCEAKMDKEE